jgi:uncharacterized membrane protein
VSDCEDVVPAAAAVPADRLVELESLGAVVAVVAAAAVLAVAAVVADVAVVAVLVVAAMQPVSTSMLVMLTAPAILRARCAGCGRGRRGAGGRVVASMTAPSGRAWDQHRGRR